MHFAARNVRYNLPLQVMRFSTVYKCGGIHLCTTTQGGRYDLGFATSEFGLWTSD